MNKYKFLLYLLLSIVFVILLYVIYVIWPLILICGIIIISLYIDNILNKRKKNENKKWIHK